MPNYQQWIAAHLPIDPRGKCVDMTAAMIAAFPELRRVRGHYVSTDGNLRRSHWWLVTAEGEILDPTVEQFEFSGIYEEYIGEEPRGQCLNCGGLLFVYGHLCSERCFDEFKDHINAGGGVNINGREILAG